MALDAGELTVFLEYASGLKDKDWFGKQDPYCVLSVGSQTVKSRTATDGGKNPVWNQTFRFNVINENDITVVVKDEDLVTRDDFIGHGRAQLARVRTCGTDRVQVPMMRLKSGRQHGFVQITLKFTNNLMLGRPQAGYGQHEYGTPQQACGTYPTPYGQPPPGYPASAHGAVSAFGAPPAGYPVAPPTQPSGYPPSPYGASPSPYGPPPVPVAPQPTAYAPPGAYRGPHDPPKVY